MNFVSDVLNSLPGVGHVKATIHYAVGDTEGGNQAMYQATRSAAVMGGGAVGCLGGPGGAVLGAMYAGVAADLVASMATNRAQGIMKGCENIDNDIKQGKNPTCSILGTAFQVGMDGVSGFGMGGVSSAAEQAVANTAVTTAGENAIQKGVIKSGEEVAKMAAKKVTKTAVATAGENAIQKTVIKSGEEVAKMAAKKVAKTAVATAGENAIQKTVIKSGEEVAKMAAKKVAKSAVATAGENAIQKTVMISGEEVAKMAAKKVAKTAVATAGENAIQKTVIKSGEEVAKIAAKKVAKTAVATAGENAIQKTVIKSGEEVAKIAAKKVAKTAVATAGENAIQKTVIKSGEEVAKKLAKKATEKVTQKIIENKEVQKKILLVSTQMVIRGQFTKYEGSSSDTDSGPPQPPQDEANNGDTGTGSDTGSGSSQLPQDEANNGDTGTGSDTGSGLPQPPQDEAKKPETGSCSATGSGPPQPPQDEGNKKGSGSCSATGSGPPQPPQDEGNKKGSGKVQLDSRKLFNDFKELLTRLLDDVLGNETTTIKTEISKIFTKLKNKQILNFAPIIERLINCGMLEEVVTIVIKIFAYHSPENISFPNFLSYLEFVATYITEEVSKHITLDKMSETSAKECGATVPKILPEVRAAKLLSKITKLENTVQKIVDQFSILKNKIEDELKSKPLSQNFRDIYSAVYHYFKHKCVPGDGTLSVKEYFDWIRKLLGELESPQFTEGQRYRDQLETQRTADVTGTVVCDLYVEVYGRRVRIVVKFWKRTTVLSSCFVVNIIYEDDEEGDDMKVDYYPKNNQN